MGARDYTVPTKAKHADVLVLSAMTFFEFPDLFVTNSEFKDLKKVTNVGPARQIQLGESRSSLLTKMPTVSSSREPSSSPRILIRRRSIP